MTTTVEHFRHPKTGAASVAALDSALVPKTIFAEKRWLDYWQQMDYACGLKPPRYPVPVTMDVCVTMATISRAHLAAWTVPWFKQCLRDKANF